MATSQQTMISHTFGVAMRTLSPMSNKERCSVSAPRSNCPRQISYARAQRFYGRMLRCVVGRVGIQDADSWRHFANEPLIFFHSFFFPLSGKRPTRGDKTLQTKVGSAELYIQSIGGQPGRNSTHNRPPFIIVDCSNSVCWDPSLRWASILERKPRRRVGRPSECWDMLGWHFFWQIISSRTARRLHLSDPMYTSATFQLDWRYPHTSCQLPYHLLSPMSPRVPHSTVFLKSFGGSKAKNETCETSTARPGLVQNPGRGRFVIDVWQSSARRPCLNLFPRWNDVHFCFEVPSDAWCSEDGDEHNVGALISSWVCVFCWATVCCVEFRWAQGDFVCLSHFTFVVAAAQTFMSLDCEWVP